MWEGHYTVVLHHPNTSCDSFGTAGSQCCPNVTCICIATCLVATGWRADGVYLHGGAASEKNASFHIRALTTSFYGCSLVYSAPFIFTKKCKSHGVNCRVNINYLNGMNAPQWATKKNSIVLQTEVYSIMCRDNAFQIQSRVANLFSLPRFWILNKDE